MRNEVFWPFSFLNHSKTFISLHIGNNISYTSPDAYSTTCPLTYHIRVPSIELYVHFITLYISGQLFVTGNDILRCRCNIDTIKYSETVSRNKWCENISHFEGNFTFVRSLKGLLGKINMRFHGLVSFLQFSIPPLPYFFGQYSKLTCITLSIT